jgi:hypothetical protein
LQTIKASDAIVISIGPCGALCASAAVRNGAIRDAGRRGEEGQIGRDKLCTLFARQAAGLRYWIACCPAYECIGAGACVGYYDHGRVYRGVCRLRGVGHRAAVFGEVEVRIRAATAPCTSNENENEKSQGKGERGGGGSHFTIILIAADSESSNFLLERIYRQLP